MHIICALYGIIMSVSRLMYLSVNISSINKIYKNIAVTYSFNYQNSLFKVEEIIAGNTVY